MEWTAVGLEGLCSKRLDESYRPVRSWRKYKIRLTREAIVGAVTGTLAAPRRVLLGRYDHAGRLHYTGRSTTLSQAASRALAQLLTPPPAAHPWDGWTYALSAPLRISQRHARTNDRRARSGSVPFVRSPAPHAVVARPV
ncbi:hypothetical protein AB0N88_36710 [Streptomyces sp. NPDC093516]|uniref:hypothetical protein n=1 Tax=Streptomyces sp. NPDC093516 TaxID=3155304 RepID=UPI003416044F